MKKSHLLLFAFLAAAQALSASRVAPVGVDSLKFDRHGEYMVLDMDLNLRRTTVPASKAMIITPLIVSEWGDTVAMHSVGIYGKQRYINFLRNNRDELTKETQTTFKVSDRPDYYDYNASVAFEDWMDNSQLLIKRTLLGCANCLADVRVDTVTNHYKVIHGVPEMKIVRTTNSEVVIDSLDGASYIDFVVDKTDINPTYRRNPKELAVIRATIDTVLNDKDVTITGVWLKGFASPESPYSHNKELAMGRTEALKQYISQLYNFSPDIITTDYEPEDWAGLRKFVDNSNLTHRQEILQLIDTPMDPDQKEAQIKKLYPADYKFMLQEFYPALRHTEYRIKYQVKRFDDLAKIRQVMRTKPNRLTLREFFLLGNSVPAGSEEFNEIFETAVRMYPDNPVANINAANAALQRKDFITAEKYLARAGDSDEANYARGVLAYSKQQYAKAEDFLKKVKGIPAAQALLDEIKMITESESQKVTRINLE